MLADQAWRAQAACRGLPPGTFWPLSHKRRAEAILICNGCPVIAQCGDDATQRKDTGVVRGGTLR